MIPLDINDPDHKPEVIWGKYYYNGDKKLDFYHSYTHGNNTFKLHDVAVFWGVKKDRVASIIEVDKTYELLVGSWLQLGWVKNLGYDYIGQPHFRPTPEGIKVAKEWKRNEKKEKYERRHSSHGKR